MGVSHTLYYITALLQLSIANSSGAIARKPSGDAPPLGRRGLSQLFEYEYKQYGQAASVLQLQILMVFYSGQ